MAERDSPLVTRGVLPTAFRVKSRDSVTRTIRRCNSTILTSFFFVPPNYQKLLDVKWEASRGGGGERESESEILSLPYLLTFEFREERYRALDKTGQKDRGKVMVQEVETERKGYVEFQMKLRARTRLQSFSNC